MSHSIDAAFAAFANLKLRKSEGITRKYAAHPYPLRNQDNGMTRIYTMDSVYGRNIVRNTANFAIMSKKDTDDNMTTNNFILNVNESSFIAHVIKSMRALDERIEHERSTKHIKSLCSPSCHQCCSFYFYVSRFEYYIIRKFIIDKHPHLLPLIISNAREQLRLLKDRFPCEENALEQRQKHPIVSQSYAATSEMFADHTNLDVFLPCVLLDDRGKCAAYEYRPSICRLYGASYNYEYCKHIKRKAYGLFGRATKKLVGIHYDDSISYNNDYFEGLFGKIYFMPFPLFYWFAHDEENEDDFILAISQSISEYKKNTALLKKLLF